LALPSIPHAIQPKARGIASFPFVVAGRLTRIRLMKLIGKLRKKIVGFLVSDQQ